MRQRPQRSAAAAAELAVLLPFLALLLGIAVDYCRVFAVAQVLNRAAFAGAMYASGQIRQSSQTPEAAGREAAKVEGSKLTPPLADGDLTFLTQSGTVSVTVTYQLPRLINFPGSSGAFSITRQITAAVAP